MTKNQKALNALHKSKDSLEYAASIADSLGVDRRDLSYLNTIEKMCSTDEFKVVQSCIKEDRPFCTASKEKTKSLECLVRLLKKGDNVVDDVTDHYVVYLLNSDNKTKIGIAKSITNRIKLLQTGNPYKITLVSQQKYESESLAREVERQLHALYQSKKLVGEWFDLTTTEIENAIRILVEGVKDVE